ncbi:MAG: hypothetical protein ACLRFJ_00920 [Alphaproteobacteria bacterium]
MKKIFVFGLIFAFVAPVVANAFDYNIGDFRFKLNASGSAGFIQPKLFQSGLNKETLFLGDWDSRAEIDYDINNIHRIGVVYAMDAVALDENQWMHELFALWQVKNIGRIEIGFTNSVAHKLGIGLPDVGGLRVNEEPLFYKKISPQGEIISDTIVSTGHSHEALRLNLASVAINNVQYGVGFASLSDEYDFAADAGIKIRNSSGKLKTALSFGASFMNNLQNHHSDIFSSGITSDWRAQASVGFNLQYNSLVWGTSVRGIYDYNPIGAVSDGIAAGTGISYDLLNYSVSVSYIMSDTGIWHSDVDNYIDNTVIGSFRYKYNEHVDLWMSVGVSSKTSFISAALRGQF